MKKNQKKGLLAITSSRMKLKCSVCGKKKTAKNFYRDIYASRGYRSSCKECTLKQIANRK